MHRLKVTKVELQKRIYIYIYIQREREREREGGGGGEQPHILGEKVREIEKLYKIR